MYVMTLSLSHVRTFMNKQRRWISKMPSARFTQSIRDNEGIEHFECGEKRRDEEDRNEFSLDKVKKRLKNDEMNVKNLCFSSCRCGLMIYKGHDVVQNMLNNFLTLKF